MDVLRISEYKAGSLSPALNYRIALLKATWAELGLAIFYEGPNSY